MKSILIAVAIHKRVICGNTASHQKRPFGERRFRPTADSRRLKCRFISDRRA
jgi:hypothetical protein